MHALKTRCSSVLQFLLFVAVPWCGLSGQSVPWQPPDEQYLPADSSQQIADRIINSKKVVLVDFWAVWCGPCRMVNPILKKLEKEFKGKVEFIKVNTDYNREISHYFQIQGIPAIFIIRDKTVYKAFVGVQPEETYRQALKETLAMAQPAPEPKKKAADTASPAPSENGSPEKKRLKEVQ